MKIHRVLCLLLVSAMLFSLCACSRIFAVSGTQTITDGPPVSGSVNVPEESETSQEPEDEDEETFSVGATVNNTYENAYFGIGITLDDNWVFKTQEEIDEVNNLVQDVLDNDVYKEALENGTVYTDMSAYANEGMINMNAAIEKLNAVSALAIDEEKYIDISLQNNDFKASFEEMGLEVSKVEKGVVNIVGEEHPCIVIEGSTQGIGFYEKVAAIKKGSYVLAITVSTVTEDVVDGVFDCFYAP